MMVPGWPYSVIVALESGRGSWTAPLDAVRLTPGDNAANVTTRQIRGVVSRLVAAGHWRPGDPEILLVADAGYDGPRLAHVLADLPITCWCGCTPTGSCTARSRRSRPPPWAGPAVTATSSPSVTRPPGDTPTSSPKPRPGFMVPP